MITETRIDIYPRTLNNILLENTQLPENNIRFYLHNYNFTCITLLTIICILCIILFIYSTIKYT
jgi:hypothetical protein